MVEQFRLGGIDHGMAGFAHTKREVDIVEGARITDVEPTDCLEQAPPDQHAGAGDH